MATYLEFALEMRRRVKEQLKKMLPFEYAKTSFSYVDRETQQEHFVGVNGLVWDATPLPGRCKRLHSPLLATPSWPLSRRSSNVEPL